jgi:hypothetical protein
VSGDSGAGHITETGHMLYNEHILSAAPAAAPANAPVDAPTVETVAYSPV